MTFNIRDHIDDTSRSAIQRELSLCAYSVVEEFERLYPVEPGSDVFVIDVYPKAASWLQGFSHCTICLKKDNPYLDFWRRWNRFCKLKAFW